MSLCRVSSRPRLCSFEEFDAASLVVTKDASDEDNEEDFGVIVPLSKDTSMLHSLVADMQNAGQSPSVPLKRKRWNPMTADSDRIVPRSNTIPPHDENNEDPNAATKSQQNRSLANLPNEVQLCILQLLDVDSLRSIRLVDQEHVRLLSSSEADEAIWKPCLQQNWPWIEGKEMVETTPSGKTPHSVNRTRYPFLLSLAAPRFASRINKSTLSKIFGEAGMVLHTNGAFQFTGAVGVGDRSVYANAPLPRPESLPVKGTNLFARLAIRKQVILCRYEMHSLPMWKPFVVPFLQKQDQPHHDTAVVNMTPRLISYFEVTILESPQPTNHTEPSRRVHDLPLFRPIARECVAVGLATEGFSYQSRMPGWDRHSFGWHGDDGGIYHNSGTMLKQFGGAHFGVGDVIGCGVDYHRRAIFYTRNGTFVDYAFTLPESYLHCNLFPVVGIDSNCLIQCNFGMEYPFLFHLAGMMTQHQDVIQHAIDVNHKERR